MTQTIKKQKIGKVEVHLFSSEDSRFNYSVKVVKDTPRGKYAKTKVLHFYGYETLESATLYFDRQIDRLIIADAQKLERKQKNAEAKASDFYALGDIVYNSWGYEQTNIEFYQVIKITNKTIEVREVAQETEPGSLMSHGMADNRLPRKDEFIKEETYKLRVKSEGRLSNPESFYYFNKWDGRPKYCSWYY